MLVALGLAGLLRPEAWVLSGLYVLYLWRGAEPRERARRRARRCRAADLGADATCS